MRSYEVYTKLKGRHGPLVRWVYLYTVEAKSAAAAIRQVKARMRDDGRYPIEPSSWKAYRRNPARRKHKSSASKRAKRLMRSGSKKLAAYVRSQANRRRKKNPVRVGAQVVGSGTGWIKAKAVKVRRVKGKGYVVDVKR